MKEFYVEDRGIKWAYKSKEKADEKAREIGGEVKGETFWKYFAPFYGITTSGDRKITGINLISAIESNFETIMKDNDLNGLSGYKLNQVKLVREDGTVYLIIDSHKLQKMGALGNRTVKKIKIEGVESGDFEEDVYVFELIK